MATLGQLKKNPRKRQKQKVRTLALKGCPQRKGICQRVYVGPPKKPNSAKRKMARVYLSSKVVATTYVPGVGHPLQQFSSVLVRGGRVRDLPGVRLKLVRGKYDLPGVKLRKQARSKYGVKKAPRARKIKIKNKI